MGRPPGSRNKITGRDKFPSCYEEDAETGCWNWTRSRGSHGYGDFRNDGHKLAHRWSYATFVGPIPDGMFVLHRCDNRRCVNPDHLFVGSADDNSKDMSAKGRQYSRGKTFEELFGEERAAEMKARMSAYLKGRGPLHTTPHSAETKAKIGAKARARGSRPADFGPAQSARLKAFYTSDEKAAHSERMKAWWAARKGRST